jgi:cell division protein FtsI (penicillin-binding protein 3)
MKHRGKIRARHIKWIRFRIGLTGVVLALVFGVILVRAVQLNVVEHGKLSKKAANQYKQAIQKAPRRGTIYDTNRSELAVSVNVTSICARPKDVSAPRETAKKLAQMLGIDRRELVRNLQSEKSFVWVKRHATPGEVSRTRQLQISGLDFITESKRFYPMKTLAAQVIGFCGTDGEGLEGLEYYYNPFLSGRKSNWTVFRDALGRSFQTESAPTIGQDGYDLVLTLDKNIQHTTQTALREAVDTYAARSGIAIVMNAATGAILAIAHVPEFNPNTFSQYEPWWRRNRAVTDCFEPGSAFKIFLAATAIESGLCTRHTRFDCENGRYEIGNNVVNDVHPYGMLSVQDILKFSSNIGAVKIGKRLGRAYLAEKLKDFGFGTRTGVDCPGETPGSAIRPDAWTEMDALAICFGQGVSTSALQLTQAVSAIANGGLLMKPFIVQAMTDRHGHVVKAFQPERIGRAVSPETARVLRLMLERVVAKGGTGQKAAVSGYRIAGKTGTAQKVDPGKAGYAPGKYVAVFAGFAPARNPAITVMVMIDEPRRHHYGGVVAAPAFSQIAKETLQYLHIPPELVTPEDQRRIRAAKESPECRG